MIIMMAFVGGGGLESQPPTLMVAIVPEGSFLSVDI